LDRTSPAPGPTPRLGSHASGLKPYWPLTTSHRLLPSVYGPKTWLDTARAIWYTHVQFEAVQSTKGDSPIVGPPTELLSARAEHENRDSPPRSTEAVSPVFGPPTELLNARAEHENQDSPLGHGSLTSRKGTNVLDVGGLDRRHGTRRVPWGAGFGERGFRFSVGTPRAEHRKPPAPNPQIPKSLASRHTERA
jgi:hypothetical protein